VAVSHFASFNFAGKHDRRNVWMSAERLRLLISCDDDNLASRRVIEANGGVFAETRAHPTRRDTQKLSTG
jgi:hypothetical protein